MLVLHLLKVLIGNDFSEQYQHHQSIKRVTYAMLNQHFLDENKVQI